MNQFRGFGLSSIPPVTKNLLIINILFFLATYGLEQGMGINLTQYLALFFVKSDYFQPFQYITYMFMHGGIGHIFFNMFALVMFGKILETYWGPKRFLIFYFVTGLGAAMIHTGVNWYMYNGISMAAEAFKNTPSPDVFAAFVKDYWKHPNDQLLDFISEWSLTPADTRYETEAISFVDFAVKLKLDVPTVGASGAIFGILMAFGVLFPNTMLQLLFPPIPIKAKYIAVIALVTGVVLDYDGNVAHFAHLGGMIFGYLLIVYWRKNQFNKN